MKIPKHEVCNVSQSAGFGYADRPGVRAWMEAKRFRSYSDYARAYAGKPQSEIQAEIEAFAFA